MTERDAGKSQPTMAEDTANETSEVPPFHTDPPANSDHQNVTSGGSNGGAIAGCVIAIIALIFAIAPLIEPVRLGLTLGFGAIELMFLAVPLGICAIVLGIIGLIRGSTVGSSGLVNVMAIVGVLGGFIAAFVPVVWLSSPGGSVF